MLARDVDPEIVAGNDVVAGPELDVRTLDVGSVAGAVGFGDHVARREIGHAVALAADDIPAGAVKRDDTIDRGSCRHGAGHVGADEVPPDDVPAAVLQDDVGGPVDHQAAHGAIPGQDDEAVVTERRTLPQFDLEDRVVAHGQCVRARPGLGIAVNDHGVRDDGQGGGRDGGGRVDLEGVGRRVVIRVRRREVKGDRVRAHGARGVDVEDRLGERAGAAVVRIQYGKGTQQAADFEGLEGRAEGSASSPRDRTTAGRTTAPLRPAALLIERHGLSFVCQTW